MWVRIRGAPYVGMARNGGYQYFAPSLQSQLGVETQIVGVLNGCAAIAMIALTVKVPKIANPTVSRVATFVSMAVIVCAVSAEVALFRRKMGSYPFRMLFP